MGHAITVRISWLGFRVRMKFDRRMNPRYAAALALPLLALCLNGCGSDSSNQEACSINAFYPGRSSYSPGGSACNAGSVNRGFGVVSDSSRSEFPSVTEIIEWPHVRNGRVCSHRECHSTKERDRTARPFAFEGILIHTLAI
jgi:hypothetical protein